MHAGSTKHLAQVTCLLCVKHSDADYSQVIHAEWWPYCCHFICSTARDTQPAGHCLCAFMPHNVVQHPMMLIAQTNHGSYSAQHAVASSTPLTLCTAFNSSVSKQDSDKASAELCCLSTRQCSCIIFDAYYVLNSAQNATAHPID